MNKKVYEVKKYSAEFSYRDRKNIKTGCCLDLDSDPESIGKFNSIEAAKEKLLEYKPESQYNPYGQYYLVTEYAIEIYTVDEDGEFVCGSDFDMVYEFQFSKQDGANWIEILNS